MANKESKKGDELAGDESVFETNLGQFNQLMTNSDANTQLEQVKENVNKKMSKKRVKKSKKVKRVSADLYDKDNEVSKPAAAAEDELPGAD